MPIAVHPLFRRNELSYPAHVVNAWACRPVEPLISGPQLATGTLRQRQVVGVVGRILFELACKLQRPDVEARRLVQFELGLKQPLNHADAVANVQFAANHAPVECVGDLEGHEVRGDAGHVRATQDWRTAWALSESSSSTSHLTARLASTTTDPFIPTQRSRHP